MFLFGSIEVFGATAVSFRFPLYIGAGTVWVERCGGSELRFVVAGTVPVPGEVLGV